MGSDYQVRVAQVEDLTKLADIERSASKLFYGTPYSFLASVEPLPLDFVQQQFQKGQVWVAVTVLNLVVGFAITCEVDDTLYLKEIDVEPAHGGKGIGRRLVETVCCWAKLHNYRVVSLSTFRNIAWNAPFYTKLGFRILDESELTIGFQQIRNQEFEAGLPISERAIMYRELN